MPRTPGLCSGLIGLACVAVAGSAIAQSTIAGDGLARYRVEVLVFRNLDTAADSEDPGRPPMPPAPIEESDPYFGANPGDGESEAIDAIGEGQIVASENSGTGTLAAGTPESLFFIPSDAFQLDEVAARIRRSRGYRLLLHESWSQPGFPSAASRPVDLLVLEQLRSLDPVTDDTRPPGANRLTAPSPGIGGARSPVLPSLSGTITLYRSRYLHLSVDLSFLTEEGTRFVIRQHRRMRSSELHYLDSPGLGVIALVVPITIRRTEDDIDDPVDAPPAIQGSSDLF